MLRKLVYNKRIFAIISMIVTLSLAVTVYASTGYAQETDTVQQQPAIHAYTSQDSVDDLLVEFGIETDDADISKNEVKTSKKILVNDAGTSYELYSTCETVDELIESGVITIDEKYDYMNVTSQDELFSGMSINITRVTHETIQEEYEVGYETKKVSTTDLDEGEERVRTAGVAGKGVHNIVVTYENGVEVKRETVSSQTTVAPVTEVIEVGVNKFQRPDNYKKVLNFSATAYCACARCCGKSTGITASGMRARYGCVAVDPRVIPLGTKLFIECPDGSYVYGYSVAADTGSAIKGNKVDLFYSSHSDALKFGRRNVKVYVLE